MRLASDNKQYGPPVLVRTFSSDRRNLMAAIVRVMQQEPTPKSVAEVMKRLDNEIVRVENWTPFKEHVLHGMIAEAEAATKIQLGRQRHRSRAERESVQ